MNEYPEDEAPIPIDPDPEYIGAAHPSLLGSKETVKDHEAEVWPEHFGDKPDISKIIDNSERRRINELVWGKDFHSQQLRKLLGGDPTPKKGA